MATDDWTFFFSGRNYEPAKTSELVEPPQPFPLTARRLNLFFTEVIMNSPDDIPFFFLVVIIIPTDGQMTVLFFSGRNYEPTKTSKLVESPARQQYLFFQVVIIIPTDRWPDDCTFFMDWYGILN